MAAKKPFSQIYENELLFPSLGVNEQTSYSRQLPGQAADALNVRVFDPLTDRARGGSRPGMAKVYTVNYSSTPSVAGTAVTSASVQDIIQMTTTGPPVVFPGHFQQFTYAQASNSGFSIGDGRDGSNIATLGTGNSDAMSCSCWDDDGYCYVAMTKTGATAVTRIYKVSYAGVQQWVSATYNITAGSLRNVCGIAWIKISSSLAYVFFAIKNSAGIAQIFRLNASNGVSPDASSIPFTETNATFQNLTFSSAAVNCLCSGGGLLGVESIGSGTNQGFRTYSPNIAPITVAPSSYTTAAADRPLGVYGLLTYTGWGGTGQSNATKVVSDGTNFYCIASTTTNILKKITSGGSLVGSNTLLTPLALEIDVRKSRLIVAYNTSQYVRLYDLQAFPTDSPIVQLSPGSQQWDEVGSDGNGDYFLYKNSTVSNNFMSVGTSLTVGTGNIALGTVNLPNTTQQGISVNKGAGSAPPAPGASPTVLLSLMVKGGAVFKIDPSNTGDKRGPNAIPTSAAGVTNAVFNGLSSQVFSAQSGTKLFFADGSKNFYFDGPTGVMVAWATTAGSLPKDENANPSKLICNWRGRIVSAIKRNLYMSKQFDGLDWNYNASPATAATAFQGNADVSGELGDLITCIIPYDDDTLVVGCDHSIWLFEGDPMDGGRSVRISEGLGIVFGRPFCFDPQGALYFMGSDCAIYKMVSGSQPVPISKAIRNRLRRINLDPAVTVIKMAWDQAADGLYVFITPIGTKATSSSAPVGTPANPVSDPSSGATDGIGGFGTGTEDNPLPVDNGDQYGDTTHYFWERRTEAWQPFKFSNRLHNPLAVYAYDGDLPEDRRIFLGGRDGYIRRMLEGPGNDDGTPIYSWVLLGPIRAKDWSNIVYDKFQAELSASSGKVRYDVYAGRTAEEALAKALFGDSPINGTLTAGSNRVTPVNREAFVLYIKLSSKEYWQLEHFFQMFHSTGAIRRWS